MSNDNQASTITELMRVLTAAAGVPMNIDQVMEQLPAWADRSVVSELLRELKEQGRTSATVEEGRVVYALAERPAPAEDVIHLDGRRAGDRARSTIEKVRDLLREATGPMTPAEVAASIPDETLDKVRRALYNGAHLGQFEVKRSGPSSKAYAIKGGVAVAITVDGQAPASVSIDGARASAPAAPPPPPPPSPAAAPPAAPAPAPAAANESAPGEQLTMSQPLAEIIAARAEKRAALISKLDAAVQAANKAREQYVLSLVDHNVYDWLQHSVRAVTAARDAMNGGDA